MSIPGIDENEPLLRRSRSIHHEYTPNTESLEGRTTKTIEVERSLSPNDPELSPSSSSSNPELTVHLRRVPDTIPWTVYCIIFTEFCERAALVGVSGPFQNYLANPLPPDGNGTGAPGRENSPFPPGALGKKQSLATALQMGFECLTYVTPIAGATLADIKFGRFKTIFSSFPIAFLGLCIITTTSTPPFLEKSLGLPGWIVGTTLYAIGIGGMKPNLAPLVADQYTQKESFVKVLSSKERVLVDRTLTFSRIYNIYFWSINLGSFAAIVTTSVERYEGFWLAYLFPTTLFIFAPITFMVFRKHIRRIPPQGSVLADAWSCIKIVSRGAMRGKGESAGLKDEYWRYARPSYYTEITGQRSLTSTEVKCASRISWNDGFVDDIQRTLKACQIYIFFPLYWLSYHQISTNLISQSATLDTRNVPNDLIRHFEAIAIAIFIPMLNFAVYPFLQRRNIPMGPIRRIYTGFLLGTFAIIYASMIQYFIYEKSPCGKYPSDCVSGPAPISVWVQLPAYLLLALSQILIAITGIEYGYTQAHVGMKSIVMCLFTITIAGGDLLNIIVSPFARDPFLIQFYGIIALVTLVAGNLFYYAFRHRDVPTT